MMIEVDAYDMSEDEERPLAELVGPKADWKETRDAQVRMLEALQLRPHHRVLDAGCGTLRVGLPLIGFLDKGNYYGVDIDPDCISEAHKLVRKFNLAESKAPNIARSSSFGRDEFGDGPKMDVIWSYQVFIHLTPELTRAAMSSIAHLLKPSGAAYITIRPHRPNVKDDEMNDLVSFGAWRGLYSNTTGLVSTYERLANEAGLSAETVGTLGDLGLPPSHAAIHNTLLKLHKG